MDAEKIILTKHFYELTPSEKEAIKEYAQNENDFNEIKSFLMATTQSFNQQKAQLSDTVNTSVLEHLYQPVSQKKTWFNTLMLFLFPKEKRFYQTPAFQLGIASVLILLIINVIPNFSEDSQLAINENTIQKNDKQSVNPNVPNEEKTLIVEDEENLQDTFGSSKEIIESRNSTSNSDKDELPIKTLENKLPTDDKIYLEEMEVEEVEVLTEITTTSQNKPAISSIEVEKDLLTNDEMVSVKESVKTKKEIKKRSDNSAYSPSRINQPMLDSEANEPQQVISISINKTLEVVNLFFISK